MLDWSQYVNARAHVYVLYLNQGQVCSSCDKCSFWQLCVCSMFVMFPHLWVLSWISCYRTSMYAWTNTLISLQQHTSGFSHADIRIIEAPCIVYFVNHHSRQICVAVKVYVQPKRFANHISRTHFWCGPHAFYKPLVERSSCSNIVNQWSGTILTHNNVLHLTCVVGRCKHK